MAKNSNKSNKEERDVKTFEKRTKEYKEALKNKLNKNANRYGK